MLMLPPTTSRPPATRCPDFRSAAIPRAVSTVWAHERDGDYHFSWRRCRRPWSATKPRRVSTTAGNLAEPRLLLPPGTLLARRQLASYSLRRNDGINIRILDP